MGPWLDLIKTADPTTTFSLANGDHMGLVQYKQRDGSYCFKKSHEAITRHSL